MQRPPHSNPRRSFKGFSLVELMVVIAIIALLLSVLIPVVSRVRRAAQGTQSQATIAVLQGAIEQYKANFGSYPGPLADDSSSVSNGVYVGGRYVDLLKVASASGFDLSAGSSTAVPAAALTTDENANLGDYESITGTHNLVLGLFGGLFYDPTETNLSRRIKYNPALVGNGPASLNPANLRAGTAYLQDSNKYLSWRTTDAGLKTGSFLYNDVIPANDCAIPSIIDNFASPMPILYLRARPGATATKINAAAPVATIITGYNDASHAYNLAHVLGYTGSKIGEVNSKSLIRANTTVGNNGLRHIPDTITNNIKGDTNRVYPYDFNLYLSSPTQPGTPRVKDTYVLISAGPDRVYGTADDITSFGSVEP